MKKLMIAFAAVAMAACAQAAQVKWSSGTLYTPNANGSWSADKASTKVGTWAATMTFYSDNSGVQGAEFTPGGKVTKSGINAMTSALGETAGAANPDGFAASTYYWAVIDISYTSAAGEQTLTSSAVRFQTQGTGATTLDMQKVGAFSSSDKFTAVPEPTSAMLLLLGFAGLALKRKQK